MPDTLTQEPAVLPQPHAKVTKPSRPEAHWLVLEYLAADNDLEGELLSDLAEMERVGSTPGVVEILAQLDRSPGNDASKGNWHGTRRYYVTRGTDPRRINSRILADLGPTNTGDPGVLESFIRFGALRYPARATALVLLNYGSGFYVPPDMQSHTRETHEASAPRAGRRRRPPIFHTTRERLRTTAPADRGVAYDDSAADCLDNQELKRVLSTAHRVLGRKVDVVGMDECLMTMIEVAYQLRGHAQVLVGSEEVEPGPGWPHSMILADLTKNPTMAGPELGAAIVQRYVESYRQDGEDATQSAIDLGQFDDLVEAVDVLARRLLAGIKSAAGAASLLGARRKTLQFFEDLYVDLHHLAANLATATGNGRIADACRDVQRIIDGGEVRTPIIAQAHVGASMAPARGISIYFPLFLDRSAFYQELDFASATHWADFLDGYLGKGRSGDAR
jgi:hypothetical protein